MSATVIFVRVLYALCTVFTWILLIYCITTWIPVQQGILADIRRALERICDPVLSIFRKVIPPIGGMVDISPIIALFVLQFLVNIIARLLLGA